MDTVLHYYQFSRSKSWRRPLFSLSLFSNNRRTCWVLADR